MKKTTAIILAIIVVLVGGVLAVRFYGQRGKGAWVCQDGQWVKRGEPEEPMPERECQEGEVVGGEVSEEGGEVFDQAKFDKSKEVAEEAIKNSPTYKFDGSDLKYESFQTLTCPNCWEFSFSFSSRHTGYGDRAGQVLGQAVTSHAARVTTQDEKVTSVVTDRTFDELNQRFLK